MKVKEHKGTINNWFRCGAIVIGETEGYPGVPDGTPITTSNVVAIKGNSLETRNSMYTLGTPAPDGEIDV